MVQVINLQRISTVETVLGLIRYRTGFSTLVTSKSILTSQAQQELTQRVLQHLIHTQLCLAELELYLHPIDRFLSSHI